MDSDPVPLPPLVVEESLHRAVGGAGVQRVADGLLALFQMAVMTAQALRDKAGAQRDATTEGDRS